MEYDETLDDALLFGGEEAGIGELETAHYVVHPFPLEATVSYGGGTADGPAAVLEASHELEFFDEETWLPYWSPGEVHTTIPVELPVDLDAAVRVIEEEVRQTVTREQLPISIGGEHTVTVGCFRAVRQRYADCGVLFIDAHLDLRDEYYGNRHSHACVARRLVDDFGAPVSWCGIRSVAAEEAALIDERGYDPVYARDVEEDPGWIERVINPLPENVYLSIDIDGLDPAYAPGTGTPEPGGMNYRDVLMLLRRLCEERTVVGADLVEVSPIEGQQVTEFTAAKILAKLIGMLRNPPA